MSDKEPDIIKVDFQRGGRVPEAADPSEMPGTNPQPPKIAPLFQKAKDACRRIFGGSEAEPTRKESAVRLMERALRLLGTYRDFQKSIAGMTRGQSYHDAMARYEEYNLDELYTLLDVGETWWKRKPQFYLAIADLLNDAVLRETSKYERSGRAWNIVRGEEA